MGIHTFYTNFIKKYPEIVKPRSECGTYDNLYMDCNSFVYEVFHKLQKEYDEGELLQEKIDSYGNIENLIIEEVKKEITRQIKIISPKKYIFIAFDGVAEKSKKRQQRDRRFKKIIAGMIDNVKKLWDTNQITAGTPFMEKLSESIYEHFHPEDFGVEQIDISCSDEPGEGEHKFIIQEGRDIIYGMDSDLLMIWNIDLYRGEDEVICVSELEKPVNKKYILLGNDYIPGLASFQELEFVDIEVNTVEDFQTVICQVKKNRKSDEFSNNIKTRNKLHDNSQYVGTSRVRYYKAMCNTTDINSVCRKYFEGLKYSLEMYINKKSVSNWSYCLSSTANSTFDTCGAPLLDDLCVFNIDGLYIPQDDYDKIDSVYEFSELEVSRLLSMCSMCVLCGLLRLC